jgi:hypothetical protein
MLTNVLRRASKKRPMQNPRNPEVYSDSLAAARSQPWKSRSALALDYP